MQAGLLNKIITLTPIISEVDSYGKESRTKDIEHSISTRARVIFKGENRVLENNEIFYSNTLEFCIRSYHNINEDYIVTFKNRDYRILSIDNTKEDRITIIAELIND